MGTKKMFTSHQFVNRSGAFAALALSATMALAEDYNGTPTGHLIYRHNTAQIKAMISDGWRPTSIGFESSVNSAGYFRVAYVQNSGSHYKECRFEGDATEASIQAVRNAGWRIEDIEYQGASRFAGIFIRNLVAPRTTLWFTGSTATGVSNWLAANPTYRLLEIDRSGTGANERFSGVYVRNSGAAYVPRKGWYPDATMATINSWAATNDMRVVDLDQGDTGRYAAVFEPAEAGERYYWFTAVSLSRCLELLQGMGLRAVTMNPRISNGQLTYAMTCVNNTNAQGARLADLAFPTHTGFQGFYVQRVGSASMSVDLSANRAFHPSSSIKALFHYTGASLTPVNQLNTRMINGQLMVTRHRNMMLNSDNPDANLLMDTYTIPTIEAIAHNSLGMSQVTQLRNRMGTGGPYGNDQINETTLVDMGLLYQAIQGNRLGVSKTNWMQTNMLNQTNSGPWNNVINDERADLGLSGAEYNDWLNRLRYVLKAGSNSDGNDITGYWSVCGVMTLPFKSGEVVTNRPYVFGHFVNRSGMDYVQGWNMTAELLREQIRASMATFN